jgi:shikimate kinase
MTTNSPISNLQNLNIYLIGMMGCGKSTIGQILAQQVGYGFLDTDTLIERLTKQSINEIFATVGEEEFRSIESQVLSEVSAYTRLVVSTGGGIVLRQANWGSLRQGVIVWLDVSCDVLWQRLVSDQTRPLLQAPDPQAKLREILDSRRARYAEADLKISINSERPPSIIAAEILEKIPTVLKSTVAPPITSVASDLH